MSAGKRTCDQSAGKRTCAQLASGDQERDPMSPRDPATTDEVPGASVSAAAASAGRRGSGPGPSGSRPPGRGPVRSRFEPRVAGFRASLRYAATRLFVGAVARAYVRLRVDGATGLPRGPYVLCFNHQNWTDPLLLLAVLPREPRVHVLGPKEEDMARGWRNRLMGWTGTPVPFRPAKDDLLGTTRRVQAVFESGGLLAIAAEGRIHSGEGVLLPLSEGAAFFALRSGLPIVPCALNGTSWLCFGRTIRVRFGTPIPAEGRATQVAVQALTERIWAALHELCQGYPDPPPPGPFGRWFTELFNEWPEGTRPAPPHPGGA